MGTGITYNLRHMLFRDSNQITVHIDQLPWKGDLSQLRSDQSRLTTVGPIVNSDLVEALVILLTVSMCNLLRWTKDPHKGMNTNSVTYANDALDQFYTPTEHCSAKETR